MDDYKKVASRAEIPADSGKTIELDGKSLAVFNIGGAFYAIDNTCLHKGGPLGEGVVDGSEVTCPWHGWVYDIKTGANTNDPEIKVKVYPVKMEGEDILVSIQ